jgi:hypothetical protein
MSISITIGAIMSASMGSTEVTPDLSARLEAAEARIAELSVNQDADWMTEQRSEQIRGLVQDVLSDADTRASLQGDGSTSGYNDGFYIQSADGKWSMKINGLFQERFNVGSGRGGFNRGASIDNVLTNYVTSFGFETTRAALNFSGSLAGDIYYNARLDWSPYNNGNGSGNRVGGGLSNSPLEWAYGGFSLNDNMKLQMGRQKYDVQRAFIVNAENQLAIERGAGTYFWYTSNLTNGAKLLYDNNNLRGNVMFSNGSSGNGAVNATDWKTNHHGWGVTGRGEMLIQGDWSQFDQTMGSTRGAAMGMMLGVGAGYLKNENRSAQVGGGTKANNNWLVSADYSIAADGWSLMASGTYGENRNNQTNENALGFEVLGGYWLSDADQAYARWQWLAPGRKGSAGPLLNADPTYSTNLNMVTVGWNHHMGGNVKLSVDWSWNFSDPSTTLREGGSAHGPTGYWGGGATNTSGSQWLLRTQLQVAF